jgi:hypothetical protein
MRCQLADISALKEAYGRAQLDPTGQTLAADPTRAALGFAQVTALNLTDDRVAEVGVISPEQARLDFGADRGFIAHGRARPGLMEGVRRVFVASFQRDDNNTVITCAFLYGTERRDIGKLRALQNSLRFATP